MPADSGRRAPVGLWTAVALVVGNMVGSGIFLLPAALAPLGGYALLGWIASAAGSIVLALVFARLSRIRPLVGGPYAYTRLAFGDLAGFLVAWGYWISAWCGNAAIAIAFVGSLKPFAPTLVDSPPETALVAAAAVWLMTLVNIRGVREAGRVQVWTTALKVLPLVFIGVAGFVGPHAGKITFDPMPARRTAIAIAAAATLTLWAFGGLESATVPADSVVDPERTIPRATIVGTIVAATLYVVSSAGLMNVIPTAALGTSAAPFSDAAGMLFGARAADLVALGAAIACAGALNGWILVASQVSRAVADDGLFPSIFARVGRHGTPTAGLVIASGLTTSIIALNASRTLVDVFTFVILLGALTALVPYAFSSLAGFLIDSTTGDGRMTRADVTVALLAFAYSAWAIGGAGSDVVYWGFLLLLAGLPVYVWMLRTRRARK